MVTIIGTENCSKCSMIKGLLDNKNINYEYKLFESLSNIEKNNFIELANKNNQVNFPLIIRNNQLISIKEV
jgi:glutaredoxin